MWIFYSRIYTTHFWRYVVDLSARDGSMINSQPERAIANPIADVDSQITKFCTAFADLRKDFDSRALLHVALVLRQTELVMSQMSSSVDAIRAYL